MREHELAYVRPLAEAAFRTVHERTGPGHEMLGKPGYQEAKEALEARLRSLA